MKIENTSRQQNGYSSLRARLSERGQVLPMVAFMMMAMLGVTAMVVDVGRVFISYHQLQASTDASALAGAQALPTSASAISQANTYSSATGDKNVYNNLTGVTMVSGYPKVECLTLLKNIGEYCDGTTTYNAIQVSQTVSVPTTFAAIFGTKTVPLTATSTAAEKGAPGAPSNIAVILDQTASMGSAGSDSCTDPVSGTTYSTRNDCALVGLKVLLLNTAPCLSKYTTCPTDGTDAVDMISVFVFPNFQYNTGANSYTGTCNPGFTHATSYSFPYLSTAADTYPYSPNTKPVYTLSGTASDYQLIPFSNDYRLNDGTSTLNTSSDLVKILGPIGGSSCKGLQAPGGLSTFYAGALAAAQGALLEEQSARGDTSFSHNAIILLSDGAANTADLASTYLDGDAITNTTTTKYPYYNSTSSKTNQCQQAVSVSTQIASNWSSNPTTIYSVAYGATTSTGSSGCSTDNGAISPCTAMTNIASSPKTFFSDYTAVGGDAGCTSAQEPFTGLSQIFGQIAGGFSYARLIPNGTT